MERLNFPVFGKPLPENHRLTMDEYLNFVLTGMKCWVSQQAIARRRREKLRYIPFKLDRTIKNVKGKSHG